MRVINLKFVKFASYVALVAGLSASALASCGDSLAAMAASAASLHTQLPSTQRNAESHGQPIFLPSIVGLWDTKFMIGDQTIQEAFQLWNLGGTEIHNPNTDPRSGNVCLGVWKRSLGTYTLTHRVWNYDSSGNFLGTIHLSETLTVGNQGTTHTGSFKLDFYDPSGVFQSEVAGTVEATRIPVD